MAEPTLTAVFGSGATQSSTTLTISKADLAAAGLTASSSNTAESLVVALLITIANTLTETQRQTDTTNRNVTVTYAGQDQINQGGTPYRRDVWSTVAYKQTTTTTVDPDDY